MKKTIAAVAIMIGLTACDQTPVAQTATNGCQILAYGENVWYFKCAYSFGPALAEFRKTHKIISVTSYAGGDTGTDGYWVIAAE